MTKEHIEEQEMNDKASNDTQETTEDQNQEAQQEEKELEAEAQLSPEEKLEEELTEAKDKYLRLYSEFENFRRRSAKERLDLVKTASEDVITELLPVLDDFERAQNNSEQEGDKGAAAEGLKLIHQKLKRVLENKGLKPMDGKPGMEFDSEFHEAITKIPAPDKKLKGKVVDVVEKGYLLNEKVIRFAKVVIGE